MLEKRWGCCAVITGDTIVVMGSENEEHEDLDSVECFTMGGSTWEYLPAMNKERYRAVAEVFYLLQENMCKFDIYGSIS